MLLILWLFERDDVFSRHSPPRRPELQIVGKHHFGTPSRVSKCSFRVTKTAITASYAGGEL